MQSQLAVAQWPPQAPNVQALTSILHCAQAALRAVVHVSQGSYSIQDAPSALSSLANRVLPTLHEIAAAHVGLAAAQALQGPMTPARSPNPTSS